MGFQSVNIQKTSLRREMELEASPRDRSDSSSILTVGLDDSAWPEDIFLSIQFDPQPQRQAL